jgi:hypothetical protein
MRGMSKAALNRFRTELLAFCGPNGGESVGIVDLVAIRKHHGKPVTGTSRGDTFQIVLIQVKGGKAPDPTEEDCRRLRLVAKHMHARKVLLASWEKGRAPVFYQIRRSGVAGRPWAKISDLGAIFR